MHTLFSIEKPTVIVTVKYPGKSIYESIANFASVSAGKTELNDKSIQSIAKNCIKSKHYMAIEPIIFYIDIRNISRVCSHQFVRSRLASIIEQSQRYCEIKAPYVFSEFAFDGMNEELKEKTINSMLLSCNTYENLIKEKIHRETARCVLPQSLCTNLNSAVNARELSHILNRRLCRRTQAEYRYIAEEIYKQLENICLFEPYVMEDFLAIFRPDCVNPNNGYKCYESNSCKNPRHDLEGVIV